MYLLLGFNNKEKNIICLTIAISLDAKKALWIYMKKLFYFKQLIYKKNLSKNMRKCYQNIFHYRNFNIL